MEIFRERLFYYRGYSQALFFLGLLIYLWYFPPSEFFEGTWIDVWMDVIGIGSQLLGELLRIWAISHAGQHTRSRRLKAPVLVTTGPYACTRNPIYAGNFLIGLGLTVLSEALVFIPIFCAAFFLQYRAIIGAEENFLAEKFGAEYANYTGEVPRWFPTVRGIPQSLTPGSRFFLEELGTAWGIIVGSFFIEWIESPVARVWLSGLCRSVAGVANWG
ncbi:MAG TPA: isoprenylcysteine carboxylmethyltransferase family protein [Candidatus Eisenbacteria bacterium]|nr:isoprenylcysteine carboxylmethyltransferase family protein [Candidatus Eisenbacteria bacterium]